MFGRLCIVLLFAVGALADEKIELTSEPVRNVRTYYYYPAPSPVYYAPAPAPVYYAPAPAPVYAPAPVVYAPAPAPIVYAPAPITYAPAPVVYAPAPAPAPIVYAPAPAPCAANGTPYYYGTTALTQSYGTYGQPFCGRTSCSGTIVTGSCGTSCSTFMYKTSSGCSVYNVTNMSTGAVSVVVMCSCGTTTYTQNGGTYYSG